MSAFALSGRFHGKRVAVLRGGLSAEREVSLNTGRAIAAALRERPYTVVEIDPGHDLPAVLSAERIDVVFNALHGTYGEDGRLQGLLDWMNLPYTGDGLRACLLSMDKQVSKELFRLAGVPVAADVVWLRGHAVGKLSDLPFPLPVVVKPVAEGSSVGVTVVREAGEFDAALAAAFAVSRRVLVEQFVAGPELSVVTLVDRTLGAVEIEPAREFYDYEAKYGKAGTRYHIPPRLPEAVRAAAEAAGLAAHRALGCRGVTRTDIMCGADGPVVLEVNTLPGMTATSLVPKVAAAAGLPFADLLEFLLDRAACGEEA
jgi:D-alanine-D-alanine ligase